MAIPEHDQYVKARKRIRNMVRKDKNYYALITNRQNRMKLPVFRKSKMRKITIWFAKCDYWRSFAIRKSKKHGFDNLVDYYKHSCGPHYRKWGKYKS